MKKNILLTLAAVLVTACMPQDTQIPQSPLLPLLERKSGLIAYIGTDGNIYLSDQAGGKLAQLTDDSILSQDPNAPFRYYQFPVWSKDGNRLAFVGLSTEGEITETKLFVHDLEEETTGQVYASRSEYPFYLNWSPDNANIGFITTTAPRTNIILKSVPAAGGETKILDAGSPYYWSWAPDGSTLIVHAGSETTATPAHLSFLRMGGTVMEYALEWTPASFQAPAWSPDGSRIALTRRTEGKNELLVTDGTGVNPQVIGTFIAKTAFAWSFDSAKLAYLDAQRALSDGTVGSLHVHDLETAEEVVVDENIIAFFWSPDNREIAYFILLPITPEEGSGSTEQQYALQLKVLDVKTGQSRELYAYRPTDQFLNILPYFDQYHQSVTIWSPDSNNLVLSYLAPDGTPSIAVVAASGTLEPRPLTTGFIAFWSWK
ncbi:MAG: PD40 domain-containing protein [Chloroflexi bacterium]|nr:PD40 domain-containing protein [Chloroflexota bacterium]